MLKRRLATGDFAIGTFQIFNSTMAAEVAGQGGLDFVVFDQEHGPLTAESSVELCIAAERSGASPIIRVRENSQPEIQRALDIGAAGVQIPQIECLEDAENAVNYARFDPIGNRGLSQYVRAGDYVGGDDYTKKQNDETLVIGHIEGEAGVRAIDDILTVEGLDVLFLGPYDLSQSIGHPGEIDHPRVIELMEDVCEKTGSTDKIVGTFADDIETARKWIDVGVQYVTISVDAPLLAGTYQQIVAEITSLKSSKASSGSD